MSSRMYKKSAARCIRIDRNRNSIVMLGPEELPANHSCEYCTPIKHEVPVVLTPAKVQLTKSKASRPSPTPPCIKIDYNRNIVTMVDDNEFGDDHRCVACDGVQEAATVNVPKIQMVRRKTKAPVVPKAPSAYFGKTMERYLEEARINDEDRALSKTPKGQMVSSSTAASERLRSSLAVLGGGSGKAHVRAARFSAIGTARRRSSERPRHSSGRRRSRHSVRFNRNRNTVTLLDEDEQTADHGSVRERRPNRTPAQAVSLSGTSRLSRSWSACSCVRFNRNRNSIVLVDPEEITSGHRCVHCETNLVTKNTMKTPVRRIRAML